MNQTESRLSIFDKTHLQRARETFQEQEGTMDLENTTYLLSILEVSSEVDYSIILNAINLSHSWAILGQVLPQRVMNRMLLAAFRHPKLIPKLSQIALTCDGSSWIFHAVSKVMRHHIDLVKESITQNSPVWTDFLLPEFAEDFYVKSEHVVDDSYEERSFALLIECVLFNWPVEKTREVEVGRDLATSFARFCLEANTDVANELLSYLTAVIGGDLFGIVAGGYADRLNAQCLAFLYMKYGADKEIRGNMAIMGEKLIPLLPKQAKKLLSEIKEDDPERETLQCMLKHYDEKTKRFVVD